MTRRLAPRGILTHSARAEWIHGVATARVARGAWLVKHHPERSDEQIAEEARLDPDTIADIRKKLVAGGFVRADR
jgi:hypothetical protein